MARNDGWWLSSSEHVLSDDVPAPPAEVRDFYGDLHNITELHPLVVSVRTIAIDETADCHTRLYRVRDRIPLGPLTIGVTYTAQVRVPTSGDVLTEARQFPGVRLYGEVSFEQVDRGTRLTERLRIVAPHLLITTIARKAVTAHLEMLASIRRHFD